MEFIKLSKEQITVVKSTLRSLNSTLLAVSENERILSKGLEDMAKHINKQDGEVKRMFTSSSMMLTVNEHSMQLNRAIDECRTEYEILIDAIMNSQKGVLQPQIITPAQIMKHMKTSQADMPPDLSFPLPLSAAYQHSVLRITDFDVFLKGNFLVYISILKCSSALKASFSASAKPRSTFPAHHLLGIQHTCNENDLHHIYKFVVVSYLKKWKSDKFFSL